MALGGSTIRVHSDYAATGTSRHSRRGLHGLLQDAKDGHIDLVLAEALDRISRDQEDLADIYKRLRYWNVRLHTIEEGEVQSFHICIGAIMSHAWMESLVAKTKRGQVAAVHDGRIPTGLSYGYRQANRIDDNGRPLRGMREIHPQQSEVVRRIYRLYVDGTSAREIASVLNSEGVPGPRGRRWGQTTINGNRTRRTGILNNELYRGRLLYGRQRFIRDPETGKRQARTVPRSEWIVGDVPDLRIVDDDLWERVQVRRRAGHDRRRSTSTHTPLPLTGIVRCATCSGPMTIAKTRRYACPAHRSRGTCNNARGIDAERIEREVCTLLSNHIAERDRLLPFMRRAAKQSLCRRERIASDIQGRKQSIARLLEAVETGAQSAAAHRRIQELEHETAALEMELQSFPILPDSAREDFTARLKERLTILHRTICSREPEPELRHRALLYLGTLIDRIDVVPLPT